MNITYNSDTKLFKIDTENTSYVIAIVDREGFIGHAYYGARLADDDVRYLTRIFEGPFTPETNARDRLSFYDAFPFEYPTHGIGDYRESALKIQYPDGTSATKLNYKSHTIFKGKKKLAGLPATWGSEEDSLTLEIEAIDPEKGLTVILSYSVFKGIDAICRSTLIQNTTNEKIKILKAMSACLDMDNNEYDKITLYGSWARERSINRTSVNYGVSGMSSKRGEGGHQEQAFTCLMPPSTTQNSGEVYGMNLVYSGCFETMIDRSQFDYVRLITGINHEDFCWTLEPSKEFQTPEANLVYSNQGIGGMSRIFHDLYRDHLIRGYYRDKKRPILLNNWEATYFDFNEEKLIAIADQAGKLGIEMLVMDDGWFGNRFDDNRALGDWVVNEEKLKGGLSYLVSEVNKRGLKFGMWFEPEMICPDSDLFRSHPDWAIQIPGREPGLARNQMVLDYSRQEVVDAVYDMMKKVLTSANVEYVKWDMNRPLSDLYSAALPSDRQGELLHRYCLGVYSLQERLITDFPKLLLENCSSGGARFDAGMLYYGPQIWCSDNTDAICRLQIQEGTELIYPLSAMGAHVSDCPNHTVGRNVPFSTRGHVALAGTFGYELDVTRIPEADRNLIPWQVKLYHKFNDLVRTGDYYRMASVSENGEFDCYMVAAKDATEALVTVEFVKRRPNMHSRRVKLYGLDPNKKYRLLNEDDTEYTEGMTENKESRTYLGSTLMTAGINLCEMWGDYASRLIHVVEC